MRGPGWSKHQRTALTKSSAQPPVSSHERVQLARLRMQFAMAEAKRTPEDRAIVYAAFGRWRELASLLDEVLGPVPHDLDDVSSG